MLWPSAWLAVVLIGVKTSYVPRPDYPTVAAVSRYFRDLALLSAADLLFAIALGLVGALILRLTRPWRSAQTIAWYSLLALCLASTAYAVASLKFIEYLRTPLTYRLLRLGGDITNMESSLRAEASAAIFAALLLIPIIYALVVWASHRWLRLRHASTAARIVGAAALLLLLASFLHFNNEARTIWQTPHDQRPWPWRHEDRRLADSAHYTLLASTLRELFNTTDTARIDEPFPPEYLADFSPISESPQAAAPTPGLRRGPKSVIVVVLESVGTQYLSVYGSSRETTTRLENETPHFIAFDDFYAHVTNTANSLIALTLSQYPPRTWRHGTELNPRIPGTSAAQVLKPLGYRTAFISAGDNRFADQHEFLHNRGFDDVWDYRNSGREKDFSWGVRDRHMIDMLLTWIDRDPKSPFFAMTWTQGTHHPYEPAPEQPIEFMATDMTPGGLEQYLNAIAEADRQLVRLFDALRARGLDDDVIVVITGDHGEGFGEPHPHYGHTGKIYQEDVNVPLMIWSPSLFQKHARSPTIGGHIDLAPTILDLLDVPAPPDWQGRSLFSPHARNRAYFFGILDSILLGLRDGPHKYILDISTGHEQLFDLTTDPTEQQNLAPLHPDRTKYLRQRLSAWTASEQQRR